MRFGGQTIPLFHNDAKHKYENSRKLTLSLTPLIKDQYQIYAFIFNLLNITKVNQIKHKYKKRRIVYKATLTKLQVQMNENQ